MPATGGECAGNGERTPPAPKRTRTRTRTRIWAVAVSPALTSLQLLAAVRSPCPALGLFFGTDVPRRRPQQQLETFTVSVCGGKDCRKRLSSFSSPPADGQSPLVQVFRNLLPQQEPGPAEICVRSTGCLSQCGRGPNVCVSSGGEEGPYFGVDSASAAAAVLDVGCGYDPPVALVIAADRICRAQAAIASAEKELLLKPVIDDLSSDPTLSSSAALAQALTIRADARLEAAPQDVNGALEDIRRATEMDSSIGRTWRVRSDAEEAAGNIQGAMEAVSRWAEVEPSFATKAKKELTRLSSKLAP